MKNTSKNISSHTHKSSPGKKQPAKKAVYTSADTIYMLNDVESPPYELTPVQKIQKIKSGISKKELTSIKEAAHLDYDTLATLLSVGRATLLNKKSQDKFNNSVSERILAIADLYSYGYAVFEDKDAFNNWMQEPNTALNNQSPLEIADTLIGIQEIKNIIGRIEYGVYS
jgi:putative toxin-antitoxin system antitoxin component (TIGR02293 family)